MHGPGKRIPWFRHRDIRKHGIVSPPIHSSDERDHYHDGFHGGVATYVLHGCEEHVDGRMYTTLIQGMVRKSKRVVGSPGQNR